MMNFEEFISNVNKANEEIERLAAETNAMREDIDNEEQRMLDVFNAKMEPMLKAFYCGKTPFNQIELGTGIRDMKNYCEITITLSINSNYAQIGKRMIGERYSGCLITTMKKIKEKDSWDYYYCMMKLLKNTDKVIANLEQDFVRQITEYIDKKFLSIAKENDKVAAKWKEMCISDKPFYTENWTEEDIVNALEEAGRPVTRKTINELKGRFIVHLQMDGVVIRKELLDDLAQEVEA